MPFTPARLLVTLSVLLLPCACGAPGDSTPSEGEEAAIAGGRVNGGETGAMVRETTPAGFTRIEGTWTLPDYDPTQPGEPWIYCGFGDEAGIDMEVGWAFQRGDGSAAKPHRWLPYMRKGKSFVFGDETTRALPGDRFAFAAWLDGGGVHAAKDGDTLTFHGPSGPIDAMPMAGLGRASTHIRRVVGQALATTYHGQRLGTLGPATFEGSVVTHADGATQRFRNVATWRTVRGGTLYGSVKWPASGAHHTSDFNADTDIIALFP